VLRLIAGYKYGYASESYILYRILYISIMSPSMFLSVKVGRFSLFNLSGRDSCLVQCGILVAHLCIASNESMCMVR
jgi:hypothetical protein